MVFQMDDTLLGLVDFVGLFIARYRVCLVLHR